MLRPDRNNVVVEGGRYIAGRRATPGQNQEFSLRFQPDAGASQMVVGLVPGGPPYSRCAPGDSNRLCSSEGHPLTGEASHTLNDIASSLALNVDPIVGDDTVNIEPRRRPGSRSPATQARRRA